MASNRISYLIILISFISCAQQYPLASVEEVPEFELIDGDDAEYGVYFQGDMILTEEQLNDIFYPDKRNGIIKEKYRWPGGIVFYEFDIAYDHKQREYVRRGMDTIENVTCIKFYPRDQYSEDFIHITPIKAGCHSHVGRKGGKQVLNLQKYTLGVGCFKMGTIVHELIHALGFHHQQCASNRDNYIKVIEGNIKDGKQSNFIKYPPTVITDFGEKYDYGSIMHYSATAFTKNGHRTIIPLDKDATIGQRQQMSEIDIRKLNRMYNCHA